MTLDKGLSLWLSDRIDKMESLWYPGDGELGCSGATEENPEAGGSGMRQAHCPLRSFLY